jgi:hypothetical protein
LENFSSKTKEDSIQRNEQLKQIQYEKMKFAENAPVPFLEKPEANPSGQNLE